MAGVFDYFVVLAEMRTGSNFLESNLNALDGMTCHGEAFNPHFIGYPNRDEVLGIARPKRDADPSRLIAAMRDAPGMNGFRFFHDHDPRVLEMVLRDPRCAKIVLTRNPLDSYISLKIARATNQWKLTDVKRRKAAKAQFDAAEFQNHLDKLQQFQVTLLNRLQTSGQTAFYLAYEDLQELGVINGLAGWLGVSARLDDLDRSLKVQNPGDIADKVSNPADMSLALAALDRFNLTRTPNFEPRRGAAVPSYVGGIKTPLLFMPIAGGPNEAIVNWLAGLDGAVPDQLHSRMNQKQLRQWKRARPGHRSFSVLRHPALRAHDVLCRRILSKGQGSYTSIRNWLVRNFDAPVPENPADPGYTIARHRQMFERFLDFIQANLAGQTPIRIDAAWATQSRTISSFADFALPDLLLREDEIATELPRLAQAVGGAKVVAPEPGQMAQPFDLKDIYDDALERRVAEIYQRDYVMFGFTPWPAGR